MSFFQIKPSSESGPKHHKEVWGVGDAPEESAKSNPKKIPVQAENPQKQRTSAKSRENAAFLEEKSDVGELAIDVFQTENSLIIQTAIAGVKPEDLDITIDHDVVSIKGTRKRSEESEGENYLIHECYWGAFAREILLPEEVDAGKAEAVLKNGILTLSLPKVERQKWKKVEVRG